MYLKSLSIAAAIALAPVASYAAGSDDPFTPKPTQTVKDCKKGKVWDPKKKRCVRPKHSDLSEDLLYGAVREYAYAGQYENAQKVLSAMPDQMDDRVLTYWGFTHRKMGNMDLGMAFYQQALAINPDNLLARSYMGQAFVETGETYLAYLQLKEIQTRGGTGKWPEQSLSAAIRTGQTYSH